MQPKHIDASVNAIQKYLWVEVLHTLWINMVDIVIHQNQAPNIQINKATNYGKH